jgi:DNA-binding transcriptional MerR regulator
MSRQYLRPRQVANLLGISLNTVYRWLENGKIDEPMRDPNSNYRLWTPEDIERIRLSLGTKEKRP